MIRFKEFLIEIRIGDGTEVPYGEVGHGNDPMNYRKTHVTPSPFDTYYVFRRLRNAEDEEQKFKKEIIPHDKLRATQTVIDKRWKPGHVQKGDENGPIGLKDKHGNVHLINGHHRADHAVQNKQPLEVETFE